MVGDRVGRFNEIRKGAPKAGGIVNTKAAGVSKGRPASIDAAQVRAMKAQGLGASEIAKALKIGRASVYRVLEGNSSPSHLDTSPVCFLRARSPCPLSK
jgi:DNA invertase Pin-like site-specific DNA recombinase